MLNRVCIIGRLGQNPEIKYTKNSNAICTFSVATSERYTDKNGQQIETTQWHNIVCFDKLAENCNNFIFKGSLVYIEGKLKTDKWQDKNGNNRYTTNISAQIIKFLDKKGDYQAPKIEENIYSDIEDLQSHDYVFPTVESEMDQVPF